MNRIELIERKNIFKNHKFVASEIAGIQNALFDNDVYSVCDDSEKIEYKNKFDVMEYEKYQLKYDIKILTIEHHNIKTFPRKLYKMLVKLFEEVNVNELAYTIRFKNNFFGATFNKYKPLAETHKKLENITGKSIMMKRFM